MFPDGVVTGYHVFLLPKGELKEQFTTLIRTLALGNKAPIFDPHITLLSGIPAGDEEVLIEKTKILAGKLNPFSLTLGGFGHDDYFFHALYVRIEDSVELTAAHACARDVFNIAPTTPYEPHASLLYGMLSDEERQTILPALPFWAGRGWEVDSVALYRTEGTAEEWKCIGEYPLL